MICKGNINKTKGFWLASLKNQKAAKDFGQPYWKNKTTKEKTTKTKAPKTTGPENQKKLKRNISEGHGLGRSRAEHYLWILVF